MATLILNTNAEPHNIVNWKKAAVYYLEDTAIVLKPGTRVVRSTFLTVLVPEIMILKKYESPPRNLKNVSKSYIFYRDDFTCQYCRLQTLNTKKLTLDHIFPKTLCGKRTMNNIVTACFDCNQKKKDHTLEESKMKLIKSIHFYNRKFTAYTPTKYKIKILYPEWADYL